MYKLVRSDANEAKGLNNYSIIQLLKFVKDIRIIGNAREFSFKLCGKLNKRNFYNMLSGESRRQ